MLNEDGELYLFGVSMDAPRRIALVAGYSEDPAYSELDVLVKGFRDRRNELRAGR
jgi:hypothetical protein